MKLIQANITLVALAIGGVITADAQDRSLPVSPGAPGMQSAENLSHNGEDPTKPLNRFELRFQFETLPNVTKSGRFFDDRHAERLTLRSDLLLLSKPDQLALRFDLPLVWSNKPTSENPRGLTQFGLGDFLVQGLYVRTFDQRWAGAVGLRMIIPTATGDAFGDGKLQLVPTIALRRELPEINERSNVGVILRQFVSVAGSSSRKNINKFGLEPFLNIGLPNQWFVNTSPKLTYDLYTDKWFVPLDLMIGRRFGSRWIASLEYQYGLVRGNDSYNQWLEARVGYFF